jgi:hypothetical protein
LRKDWKGTTKSAKNAKKEEEERRKEREGWKVR